FLSGFYFRNEKHVSTGSATIPELVGVTVAELAEAIVFDSQTCKFIHKYNTQPYNRLKNIGKP
ncbi:MAG: hypothetical protein GX587_03205, partial [Bacteroidales bacterium]|nr:hypothetical protein [Bacteroidales bacterium]